MAVPLWRRLGLPLAREQWWLRKSRTPKVKATLEAEAPDGVAVTVTPTQLTFSNYMEHNKYIIDFIRTEVVKSAGMWESGEIVWKGKKHHARSPMAFGY